MIQYQHPQRTAIAELQKETDQKQMESINEWVKRKDTNLALTNTLLEANGHFGERYSLSFHFGANKYKICPHFTWDGAFIAHLGEDPIQGAWGMGATLDDAARDLLQELRERITPDGYLEYRRITAAA